MEQLLVMAFGISLLLVCYTYLLYPVVLWVLGSMFGRKPLCVEQADNWDPYVSILISAHNEEEQIERRIQSALATSYPADKLEIVIASDGSTDGTAAIVKRYLGKGVRLFDYKQRRGKARVLNSAFGEVRGEVVLLSDANTEIEPGALRKMVRWFRDSQVGVVVGKLELTDPESGKNVDSLYWKYENFLKRWENRLGGLLGANGGIYAIRREVHSAIPEETIVDDFLMPLQARLRTGCAIIYEAGAVAREEIPRDIVTEFHRRCRIGAGGFQSFPLLWKLLHPGQGWIAFTYLSHKVLRWLCPFFLIIMLLSNLLLADEPMFRGLLLGQVGFYLSSLIAGILPCRARGLRVVRLATMFTSMNVALLVGCWRWLRGTQKGIWKPTARLADV